MYSTLSSKMLFKVSFISVQFIIVKDNYFFSAIARLVTKWEQESLTLAVTGDVRIVRLWDAETELKKQDIPTGADCCTTCLDVDGAGWLFREFYFIDITFISFFSFLFPMLSKCCINFKILSKVQ